MIPSEDLVTCARVGILGPSQGPGGVTCNCLCCSWGDTGCGGWLMSGGCAATGWTSALLGLRLQQSQETKEKVYKGGSNKHCTMGVPVVGPRSGNRNANRIQKSRLSEEEGCPHVKNEHISCLLGLGPCTHKRPSSGLLYHPSHISCTASIAQHCT